MIILCDVDGVLADFAGAVVQLLSLHGHNHSVEDITCFDIQAALGLSDATWRSVKRDIGEPCFAWSLDAYDDEASLAFDVWAEAQGYDLHFVTAPWHSPTWCYDRAGWLRERFDRPVHFTHRKERIDGDVLVEDNAETLRRWVETQGGVGLLWDRPWNRNEELPRGGVRVSSWGQVRAAIESAAGRTV